jgi:hypothetical protein
MKTYKKESFTVLIGRLKANATIESNSEDNSVSYTIWIQSPSGYPKIILESKTELTNYEDVFEYVNRKLSYLESYNEA